MRGAAAAQTGRLLRLLFLRFGAVPADTGRAQRRNRSCKLLFGGTDALTNETAQASRDWVASTRANLLAWWLPQAGIVAGLFMSVGARTTIWSVALGWMGVACLLNARRCGRTHCRYTGPYYLAMILPVLALGTSSASSGLFEWIALGGLILAGGKLLWWVTERAWGKFRY
jgi:hypothetical protein